MPRFVALLALALLPCGCWRHSRGALVIEDDTPIVAAGRTTEALGIETLGGVFTPLIHTQMPIPCSIAQIFSTAADGQSQVTVAPYRGTNQLVAGNHSLGRFEVQGIPPAPRGTPKIQITFTVTERQILMSAIDLTSKAALEIKKLSGDPRP